MAITPIDIHNKEFSKSFRGYNEDEVDQFLDEIVEEFEKLYKNNLELKDRLGLLGDQVGHYKTMENTLKETLMTAQKAAEDVSVAAGKKSELIIREAEDRADKIIEDANYRVIEIKKEFDEYKKQMQVFKSRFKSLLDTQLELLLQEIPTYEEIGEEDNTPKG